MTSTKNIVYPSNPSMVSGIEFLEKSKYLIETLPLMVGGYIAGPSGGTFVILSENVQTNTWADNKIFSLVRRARKNKFNLPNDYVKSNSKIALETIVNNSGKVVFINPSFDGGSIIEFEKNNDQFLIDISNDKEIAFLKRSVYPKEIVDLNEDSLKDYIQEALTNAP
jgi:hypothetical protein